MAGDPADYSVIFATSGIAGLERSALELEATLRADGAVASAARIRRAYFDLIEELKTIARTIAATAHKEIQQEERSSRLRPDSGMAGGLDDVIGESHPLPGVPGSVGVNYMPAMQANHDWWWTQEIGYSGHVGREVYGHFFGPGYTDRSRPNPALSGDHPLFKPDKAGGKMTIHNPIPARQFVRRGSQIAENHWHGAIQATKRKFMAEVTTVMATAPPPKPKPGPRGPRRGPGRRP